MSNTSQHTVECLVYRHIRLFPSVSSVESRIFRLHPSPLFTRLVAVQCLYCQVDEAVTSPICRIRGKRNFCFPIIFIETYFSVGKQSQSTRSLSATAVVIPTCTFAERTNTFLTLPLPSPTSLPGSLCKYSNLTFTQKHTIEPHKNRNTS